MSRTLSFGRSSIKSASSGTGAVTQPVDDRPLALRIQARVVLDGQDDHGGATMTGDGLGAFLHGCIDHLAEAVFCLLQLPYNFHLASLARNPRKARVSLGIDFETPKRRDTEQWSLAQEMFEHGVTYHRRCCSGPGWRPRRLRDAADFLEKQRAKSEGEKLLERIDRKRFGGRH